MQTAKRQSSVQATKKALSAKRNPALLYSSKVIAVHSESTTVDVKMASGDTLRGVRVLFTSASTQNGWRYLTSIQNVRPVQTSSGTDDVGSLGHVQDAIAIIGYLDGNIQTPRVIGFDFPLDSQLHLNEDGLYVWRHESGIYEIITKEGHHETHYPDGSYVIYGPDSSPKDLSSIRGRGQAWNPPTSSTPMSLTVHMAGGVTLSASNGVLTVNGGVEGVARVGDAVQVDLQTGSGTITAGSTTFKA